MSKKTKPRAAAAERRKKSRKTEQAAAPVHGSHSQTVLDGNFHERKGNARCAVLLAVFCLRFWLRVQVLCSTAPRR